MANGSLDAPFVTVALADELLGCSDLLGAYASALGDSPDSVLVVYAPDWEPADLEARLAPALASVGMDTEDSGDVVALAVPRSDEAEEQVAATAHCVYSRQPLQGAFASRLRLDDRQVDVLAGMARRHRRAGESEGETTGVFFVATGPRCRGEAVHAVHCLRASNPWLPVTVFTDDVAAFAATGAPVEAIVPLDNPRFSFIDKLQGFLRAPYDRNLFLDADAFVVSDASDLFRLLDRFDVAACHAPGRSGARFHAYESPELPETFPQYNTGVVCFRRSPATHAAFERWLALYEANPHHIHDQPSFRQAMYESHLSSYALSPEWNFLIGAAYLSGPVRIVHGELTAEKAADLALRVNATTGPRLFVPAATGSPLPACPGEIVPT